jgi:hypothetical protein
MAEQPSPALAPGRGLVALGVERELELIPRGWRRRGSARIGLRARDDLFAQARVAREDAKIAKQMKIRRRHRCNESDHQVVGLKEQSAGAVLPCVLEPELEPTVGEPLEALLSNGRPRDVTAQPLELSPVTPVDDLLGVHVNAAHLGDRLISERAGVGPARWRLGREDEPERRQTRSVAAHRDALRGCGVTSGEPRIIERELRRRSVVTLRLEGAASCSEDFFDARCCAARHVLDVCSGRRQERMETKVTAWLGTHVHAIEREHMQVHVESERAVSALHGSDGACVRVSDAWESELFLCSPLKGAAELADESTCHLRA